MFYDFHHIRKVRSGGIRAEEEELWGAADHPKLLEEKLWMVSCQTIHEGHLALRVKKQPLVIKMSNLVQIKMS